MKKTNLVCAVLVGLSVLSAQNVMAANKTGSVTLTPGLGYDFFAGKRNLHNTVVIPEVALSYNLDDKWAIEAAYGVLNTSFKGANSGSVKGNLYTVDGLYRLAPHGMFEPFVSAGLGITYLNPNRTNATNQANINAGIGSQMFFSDSVALRGEVRDLYTMSGGKNDLLFNMGVSFLMGGDPAVVESVPVVETKSYKGDM